MKRTRWQPEVVVKALRLSASGMPDREITIVTGVPTETVRVWRSGRIPIRAKQMLDGVALCPRCHEPEHDFAGMPAEPYAQLLGLYLGDVCLARNGTSFQLRIAMDSQYVKVIDETVRCVNVFARGRAVSVVPVPGRCVNVSSYGRFWPCLLPQHGPGRKHHRRIVLEPWQRELVTAAPGAFLRGLIHSDGWRGENRVHVKGRDYSYPRYQFSNRSDDIRELFTWGCDLVGVAWRPWGRWHISVARREAVARLDAFVGPKQ